VEKAKQQLQTLIENGNKFTYDKFAEKSSHGYPSSLTPEWVAWETRCNGLIKRLFGPKTAQCRAMEKAAMVEVIGWEEDKFVLKKNYIIGVLQTALEIIDDDVFDELDKEGAKTLGILSNKVFVVHGHDEAAKTSLEIFLKEIGLDPVVLHRKADEGRTIIEKLEKHSDVGYAFVLLTPDECAYLVAEAKIPEDEKNTENRARQNVIFEFGYFVGKLGRQRVCCLYTGGVSLPSDISGMIYKEYSNSVEEVAFGIMKELKAAGYEIQMKNDR
jgi:predicted nucleotide-binding protein